MRVVFQAIPQRPVGAQATHSLHMCANPVSGRSFRQLLQIAYFEDSLHRMGDGSVLECVLNQAQTTTKSENGHLKRTRLLCVFKGSPYKDISASIWDARCKIVDLIYTCLNKGGVI